MENNKRLIEVLIIVLVLGNIFFGYGYFSKVRDLEQLKSAEVQVEFNQKIVNFTSLFVKKVLQADKEVDFETRLSLENSVRDLKDEEVMAEWQNFTSSKTEQEAQASVKKLLEILINKIQS